MHPKLERSKCRFLTIKQLGDKTSIQSNISMALTGLALPFSHTTGSRIYLLLLPSRLKARRNGVPVSPLAVLSVS